MAGWKVSLSNGETFYEGKGSYKLINGEKSPWLRLGDYMKEKDLKITSLGIFTDDNKNFHLPSNGNNPSFNIFNDSLKPDYYNYFRATSSSICGNTNDSSNFIVIEAGWLDFILQLWVDENNTNNSWCLVKTPKITKKKS
jgi:hypothetical protein